MDSGTTALQNGACTYRCISQQMHYKTTFSHNSYMKSLEIYENYITVFRLEKKTFLGPEMAAAPPSHPYQYLHGCKQNSCT
jgi:hypothetical protein